MTDDEEDLVLESMGLIPEGTAQAKKNDYAEAEKLRKCFDTVMSFPEGVEVMKHIMQLTGYDQELKTINKQTSDLNVQATLYNLSQRDLWVQVRQLLTPIQRALLESEDKVWQTEAERQSQRLEQLQRLL